MRSTALLKPDGKLLLTGIRSEHISGVGELKTCQGNIRNINGCDDRSWLFCFGGIGRRRLWQCCLMLLCWTGAGVWGQEVPESNEERLMKLLTPPVLELLADHLTDSTAVQFHFPNNNQFGRRLSQNLSDSCLVRKYLVYSTADSLTVPGIDVVISNTVPQVHYRVAGRNLLRRVNRVDRHIEGSFHLQMRERPGGKLIASNQVKKQAVDTIEKRRIKEVENSALPFTIGKWETSETRKKWLEPIMITGATATVILLFYTLRSE